jgi:hypothetical protein
LVTGLLIKNKTTQDMTQFRKVELLLVKGERTKTLEVSEVKLNDENATVADLKAAGFAKLFDADKYVKDKEEVTGTSYIKTTDESLVSVDRHLKYKLYVTAIVETPAAPAAPVNPTEPANTPA